PFAAWFPVDCVEHYSMFRSLRVLTFARLALLAATGGSAVATLRAADAPTNPPPTSTTPRPAESPDTPDPKGVIPTLPGAKPTDPKLPPVPASIDPALAEQFTHLRSPQETIDSIQLPPGYHLQLVAAEPDILAPACM